MKKMRENLRDAFTPSKFICQEYQRQSYEVLVLRPGMHLPFTELHPKKRKCVEWEKAGNGAIKFKCKRYKYVNTDDKEQNSLYHKEKRYRTVCVKGYSTR